MAELSFKIPILGNLKKGNGANGFTRTLNFLVSAGLPILDSLSIVGEAIENILLENLSEAASKQVERGVNLGSLKADKNFPPILSQMISVGEETGKQTKFYLKSQFSRMRLKQRLKT